MSVPIMTTNEMAVLESLDSRKNIHSEVTCEIAELSTTTGISNNEEVQRALYILEGKSFVAPEPAGDLTSSNWKITDIGEQALRIINSPAE